jgi:uncharacterized protein (TIGR02145 family)
MAIVNLRLLCPGAQKGMVNNDIRFFLPHFFYVISLVMLLLGLFACSDNSTSMSGDADDYCNTSVHYDTLRDRRDNLRYRTVQIGNQMWMAENLNYDTLDGIGSWCYNYDTDKCQTFGRLYDWEAALKVCPEGWHLPSDSDWVTLTDFVGEEYRAGMTLKSVSGGVMTGLMIMDFLLYGWFLFGFSFAFAGDAAVWWSSTDTAMIMRGGGA